MLTLSGRKRCPMWLLRVQIALSSDTEVNMKKSHLFNPALGNLPLSKQLNSAHFISALENTAVSYSNNFPPTVGLLFSKAYSL